MGIDNSFIELVDIDDIQHTNHDNLVDISVEDDNSFVLSNGFISHNSAVSGIIEARDSKIHAALPLKGKVMNVFELGTKKIYENEELKQIIDSIGLVPGQRANRRMLRYGKIYIATDADHDGYNILGLLTNFFYKLWPELFDEKNPFIYSFETPLIIARKGNQSKYWYAADVFDESKVKGWEISRAKGLAALLKADWRHCLEHPKVRPIIDDGELEETLSLIFSPKRADDRKVWIGM